MVEVHENGRSSWKRSKFMKMVEVHENGRSSWKWSWFMKMVVVHENGQSSCVRGSEAPSAPRYPPPSSSSSSSSSSLSRSRMVSFRESGEKSSSRPTGRTERSSYIRFLVAFLYHRHLFIYMKLHAYYHPTLCSPFPYEGLAQKVSVVRKMGGSPIWISLFRPWLKLVKTSLMAKNSSSVHNGSGSGRRGHGSPCGTQPKYKNGDFLLFFWQKVFFSTSRNFILKQKRN